MVRQVVLDTETTGLEVSKRNRIVEIGCVELVNRKPTGRTYHQYIKPDRDFEEGAQQVTGLTLEFLADKPEFGEIVDEFLDFIEGAELLIHNAKFDVGFIDYELSLLADRDRYGSVTELCKITDTVRLAKQTVQGRVSLDALCRRFGIDTDERQAKGHGALLDANLLTEVYLALTSGQSDLGFSAQGANAQMASAYEPLERKPRPLFNVSDSDLTHHDTVMQRVRKAVGQGIHVVWDSLTHPKDRN